MSKTRKTFEIEAFAARAYSVWGRFRVEAETEEAARELFYELGDDGAQEEHMIATKISDELPEMLYEPFETVAGGIKEVD